MRIEVRAEKSLASSILLSLILSLISVPAQAAVDNVTATGTSPTICNQSVGDPTSVTAERLSGGDCVVSFKKIGTTTWTAPVVSRISVVVVGGGGGGGSRHSGGGGGGGVLYLTNFAVTQNSSYSLTVGGGGNGAAGGANAGGGRAGQSSNFNGSSGAGSVVANGGGGGGGGGDGANALSYAGITESASRGNSGGTNYQTSTTADAVPGLVSDATKNAGTSTSTISGVVANVFAYGYSGAVGLGTTCKDLDNSNGWCGGGGGGANGAGATSPALFSGNRYKAGNGGAGISIAITSPSTTFAGGGGGGSGGDNTYSTTSICDSKAPFAGSGGSGGGGNGGICANTATSGTANTGGGGGGGGYYYVTGAANSNATGGAGGSGIVMIRYTPTDLTAPTFTSSTSFSAAENISISATAATIIVSESATVTISGGADSTAFNIYFSDSITALIKFKVSPNYESPADSGGNNIYDLTLTATDVASNAGTQSITITVTDVVDTSSFNSLALAGSVTTATYRSAIAITASVSVASKITFTINGKVLPGCKNRSTSGSGSSHSVTCTWKPSRRGQVALTAAATPTGAGIASATASPVSIWVGNRTGAR